MARPVNSLVGWRFGHLTIIDRVESSESRQSKWLCRCDCGNTCEVFGTNLKSGSKVSCGKCEKDEMNKEQMRQTSISLDRLKKDAADPYQNLANAIVAVAADDYRLAMRESNSQLMDSLEKFFHSGWYKTLTSLNPDTLLANLRKEHNGCLEAVYA